jgi:heme-degrading monooxygenase HmoA
MTPYTHSTWIVKPGREDEFMRLWEELADWTIAEGWDTRAVLLRDVDYPNRFVSFGPWRTFEELADWRSAEGFAERVARLDEVLQSFEPLTLKLVYESS